MRRLRRGLRTAGWPVRSLLVLAIGAYRVSLGQVFGGSCRFHPSCSAYAQDAVRNAGAVKGTGLAVWRVMRCSPVTKGGVDRPPALPDWARPAVGDSRRLYDAVSHSRSARVAGAMGGGTR